MALALEQQYHISAAARQLDTLAMLEQRRTEDTSETFANINETYIGGSRPPQADAGAGVVPPRSPFTPSATASPRTSPRDNPPQQHTPPPFAIPDSANIQSQVSVRQSQGPRRIQSPAPTNPGSLSVLHYADIGLSTELQRMLNGSTLDSEFTAGSVMGGASLSGIGQLASLAENEEHDRRTAREVSPTRMIG